MPAEKLVTWKIAWSNPHRPGENKPAELLRITRRATSTAETPPQVEDWFAANGFGTGYALFVSVIPEPDKKLRRWSEAAKQKARRSRLNNRLEQKASLFKELLYRQIIAADPHYYGDQDASAEKFSTE